MRNNKWDEHDWESRGGSGDMVCRKCRFTALSACWDKRTYWPCDSSSTGMAAPPDMESFSFKPDAPRQVIVSPELLERMKKAANE